MFCWGIFVVFGERWFWFIGDVLFLLFFSNIILLSNFFILWFIELFDVSFGLVFECVGLEIIWFVEESLFFEFVKCLFWLLRVRYCLLFVVVLFMWFVFSFCRLSGGMRYFLIFWSCLSFFFSLICFCIKWFMLFDVFCVFLSFFCLGFLGVIFFVNIWVFVDEVDRIFLFGIVCCM